MINREGRKSTRNAGCVIRTPVCKKIRIMSNPSAGPKRSARLSVQLADAARAVTEKLADLGRYPDPEEQPGFIDRNPRWEDDLPPVRPYQHDEATFAIMEDIPSTSTCSPSHILTSFSDQVKKNSIPRERWKKAYNSVMKDLILKKQLTQSAVGTGARIEGYALGLWDPNSPWRIMLFQAIYNQRTEYFVLLIICCHLLVLIFKATEKAEWVHLKAFNLDFVDAMITMFYTVECLLRILCLGLVWGPNCYLRNYYNMLDFVIVVDSWVHLGVKSVTGKDMFARIAVLRAFRGLIVLQDYSFFNNVLAVIDGVKKSVRPLENVIFLTFLLVSYYSLLAVQFLEGSLNNRCIRTNDNQVSFPMRFCDKSSGYICPQSQNQTCMFYGNVNYGITSFDAFPSAILTMFQVISLEGWSLVMYEVKDSDSSSADAYFMTLIVIGTYFLINVFVAAISGAFLRVRLEHQR